MNFSGRYQVRTLEVTPVGYNTLEIYVDDLEIDVSIADFLEDNDSHDILEEIGEDVIKSWLERQGYTVAEDE